MSVVFAFLPVPVTVTPSATKNTFEPTVVKLVGYDPMAPVEMSASCVVPAVVPSVFQTSAPADAVVALKMKLEPSAVQPFGLDPAPPGLMSFTSDVPPGVPSVCQNSAPCEPSSA